MVNSANRNWRYIVDALSQNLAEINAEISAVAQDCVVRGCFDEISEDELKVLLPLMLLAATRSHNLRVEFVHYIDARLVRETNIEVAGYYLAILIWNDPIGGVRKATETIERCALEMRQETAWKWLKFWFGRRDQGLFADKQWRIDELSGLTELMAFAYQWAAPKNDRLNSTATLYRYASNAREMIETVVLSYPGVIAYQNFEKILGDNRFSANLQWFDHRAVVRLEKEAEPTPQTISEFRAWVAAMSPSPPSNAEQLQERVRAELEELQEWLATSDRSPQNTWAAVTDELQMHRLIQVQLEQMAKELYTIDAEAETVDGNPIDFRVRFGNLLECAIELKIAIRSHLRSNKSLAQWKRSYARSICCRPKELWAFF